MAVPDPAVRFLRPFMAPQAAMGVRIPAARPRHSRLLLDSGRTLMMLAAVVLTHQLGTSTGASSGNAEFVLLAFLLWLLGAALTSLSIVAPQFPRLAAAGVTVARALRNFLLGGL